MASTKRLKLFCMWTCIRGLMSKNSLFAHIFKSLDWLYRFYTDSRFLYILTVENIYRHYIKDLLIFIQFLRYFIWQLVWRNNCRWTATQHLCIIVVIFFKYSLIASHSIITSIHTKEEKFQLSKLSIAE